MTLDPTEVCDWLRKNNGAYGRAAKHFGLPKDEVRRIWAENKSKPLSRASPASRAKSHAVSERVKVSALASIEWEMTCVLEDIEEVKGQDKATTALSSLRRTYRELRKDYSAEKERLRLAGHDDTEALTPEQAIAGLRQMVAIAPEQVIEALEEAIELRRNPPDRLEG